MCQRDLCIFQQNVGRLSLFRKNIFPFSYIVPFVYDKSANEGTINFWQNLGQFPHLPQKEGDETTNPSTGY